MQSVGPQEMRNDYSILVCYMNYIDVAAAYISDTI
jgi:hypothetical protein